MGEFPATHSWVVQGTPPPSLGEGVPPQTTYAKVGQAPHDQPTRWESHVTLLALKRVGCRGFFHPHNHLRGMGGIGQEILANHLRKGGGESPGTPYYHLQKKIFSHHHPRKGFSLTVIPSFCFSFCLVLFLFFCFMKCRYNKNVDVTTF